jgi:hypothetical protein
MNRFFELLIAVISFGVGIVTGIGAGSAADHAVQMAPDPLNATYWIAGQPVGLVDGQSEYPAAPGSAMAIRTVIWRQPVYADLDGDGDEDAALVLVQDPGGSGTFYYVAAAINIHGQYLGTNTVLLGDRIHPADMAIRNHVLVVDYLDRRPAEPLGAIPSVNRTMALVVRQGELSQSLLPDDREAVTRGWVTIGHEVRSFRPCNGENDLWLMGSSPALKAIMAAYRQVLPDPKDYGSVIMLLSGQPVDPPAHGFGADYDGAFLATRLVRVIADSAEANDPYLKCSKQR